MTIREGIASKIIVDCGYDSEYPCPHAHPTLGYEKCPHLDEDVCMWQREQADQILDLLKSQIKEMGLSDEELRQVLGNSIENPTDFTFEVIEALGLNYERVIAQAQLDYIISKLEE